MSNLQQLNLYRSYAHDGSQKNYKALDEKGVRIISGSAYRQNYIPGILYKSQVGVARFAADFSDRYDAARKLVTFLQPPKKYSGGEDETCINNHTGGVLNFLFESNERTSKFRLAHNSWSCLKSAKNAMLSISHSNHGPKICTVAVKEGQTITVQEFDASDICNPV